MTMCPNGVKRLSPTELQHSVEQQSADRTACFNVTTSWKGGFQSESTCDPSTLCDETELPANRVIQADEPAVLGGTNAFPNPQELMLAAFNACMTAAYVTAAREADVTLENLEIKTSGTIDLQGFLNHTGNRNPDTESIRYVITVKGSGTRAQFERIHQMVIATSPNRWLIGGNMVIEGDQIVA